MTKSKSLDISQAQNLRLKNIDFCLFFLGEITRKTHMDHFGVSTAAATRDLTTYKTAFPQNVDYDLSQKSYKASINFLPQYEHEPLESIRALSKNFKINGVPSSPITCENPTKINSPDLQILSTITSAMFRKKVVKMQYCSLSSGDTTREFVPLALVDNGLRWHVRGFDRRSQGFRDFVINRIKSVSILVDSRIEEVEKEKADIQWNRIVEMEIVPHPSLEHKEAIIHEYGMKDEILKINARAAVAGYFLRLWNIDCSHDHSGPEKVYRLWLKNNLALYGIVNHKLAPLYTSPDEK